MRTGKHEEELEDREHSNHQRDRSSQRWSNAKRGFPSKEEHEERPTQKAFEIQGPHTAEYVELGTKDDEDRGGVADDAIEGTQPRVPGKKILHWKGHRVLLVCGDASIPHPIPADHMN